jgi:hypothetical protein
MTGFGAARRCNFYANPHQMRVSRDSLADFNIKNYDRVCDTPVNIKQMPCLARESRLSALCGDAPEPPICGPAQVESVVHLLVRWLPEEIFGSLDDPLRFDCES